MARKKASTGKKAEPSSPKWRRQGVPGYEALAFVHHPIIEAMVYERVTEVLDSSDDGSNDPAVTRVVQEAHAYLESTFRYIVQPAIEAAINVSIRLTTELRPDFLPKGARERLEAQSLGKTRAEIIDDLLATVRDFLMDVKMREFSSGRKTGSKSKLTPAEKRIFKRIQVTMSGRKTSLIAACREVVATTEFGKEWRATIYPGGNGAPRDEKALERIAQLVARTFRRRAPEGRIRTT